MIKHYLRVIFNHPLSKTQQTKKNLPNYAIFLGVGGREGNPNMYNALKG